MSYDNFFNWLLDDKKLSQRAAKDVISRCKRICKILNVDKIGDSTIEKLNINTEFSEKSMFIKSQLRRACTLWVEFGGK
ncbi:MAG: hypothetical protein IJO74_05115 [Clostridia bacterium]|nr:hypothetical protein [Clostridia bacterium]